MRGDFHPVQIEALRRLSYSERFARGLRFLKAARKFLAAGIRARHPDWGPEQVEAEVRRAIHHGRQ
jgi:hypothetical protein